MNHRFYLDAAMKEAEHAHSNNTYPVGAVIVSPDGKIISRGHNRVYKKGDFTAHAEIEAIRKAGPLLMKQENFEKCTLYTTWEPCLMCCGAILLASIKHIIWVMDDENQGGLRLLHENRDFLDHPYYVQKLDKLEISPANHQDQIERMQAWMADWNGEKETVLDHWRQKARPMEPSSV